MDKEKVNLNSNMEVMMIDLIDIVEHLRGDDDLEYFMKSVVRCLAIVHTKSLDLEKRLANG